MERQPCALFTGARANNPCLSDAEIWALIDAVPDRAPKAPDGARHRHGSRPAKPAHIQLRRRWAASGKMPASLAHHFTPCEQAALAVVAYEVCTKGDCRKSNKEIADMAGVGLSTVKAALRQAKALGYLKVEERRVTRWRNDTNVVSIVSAEWRTWLRLGGGVKLATPIKINILDKKKSPAPCPHDAGLTRLRGERKKAPRLDGRTISRFG